MSLSPECIPDFKTVLDLWLQAHEETDTVDLDPQVFKHLNQIKPQAVVEQRFRELLWDYIYNRSTV